MLAKRLNVKKIPTTPKSKPRPFPQKAIPPTPHVPPNETQGSPGTMEGEQFWMACRDGLITSQEQIVHTSGRAWGIPPSTPLAISIREHHIPQSLLLVEHLNPSEVSLGCTAARLAVKNGQLEVVQAIFHFHGLGAFNEACLSEALRQKNLQMAEFLLESGLTLPTGKEPLGIFCPQLATLIPKWIDNAEQLLWEPALRANVGPQAIRSILPLLSGHCSRALILDLEVHTILLMAEAGSEDPIHHLTVTCAEYPLFTHHLLAQGCGISTLSRMNFLQDYLRCGEALAYSGAMAHSQETIVYLARQTRPDRLAWAVNSALIRAVMLGKTVHILIMISLMEVNRVGLTSGTIREFPALTTDTPTECQWGGLTKPMTTHSIERALRIRVECRDPIPLILVILHPAFTLGPELGLPSSYAILVGLVCHSTPEARRTIIDRYPQVGDVIRMILAFTKTPGLGYLWRAWGRDCPHDLDSLMDPRWHDGGVNWEEDE